jgi:hypothetical protein
MAVAVRESLKRDIDALPEEALAAIRDFLLFQRYKIENQSDTEYLSSLPGMMDSIREGGEAPRSECVPLEEVWPSV